MGRSLDLLVVGGHVWTGDPGRPRASALGVRGSRVAFVGPAEEARLLAGAETDIVEAAGKLLVPGFIDAHNHVRLGSSPLAIDLGGAASLDELKARVRAHAEAHPGQAGAALPGAEGRSHVVVVGGGVAGAEAARRAAARGSRVTLLEAEPELGGRARTAGLRRGRERWALYLDWLAGQLQSHGVDVRLGQATDANDIAALDPDFVILATGSRPRRAGWHDNYHGLVADADEVIVSPPEPRGSASAIIIDQEGGFTAPTAAESLCHAGWTVQIITDLPFVAARVDATQVWFVRRRLKRQASRCVGTQSSEAIRTAGRSSTRSRTKSVQSLRQA